MASTTTTTTTLSDYMEVVTREAKLGLSARTVFAPGGPGFSNDVLDIADIRNTQGMSAMFGELNVLTASEITEDSLYSGWQATSPTTTTITAGKIQVGTIITWEALNGAVDEFAPWATAGRQLAQAMATKIDTDVCATFSSFSTTVGSTGVNLTFDNIKTALQTLVAANLDENITCVLHSQQWADLMSESGSPLIDSSKTQIAEGFYGNYFYDDLFGGMVKWLITNNVALANADADRCGAMFGQKAIGLVWKSDPVVESEWDKDYQRYELLMTAYYNADIADDDRGVKIVTDA